MRLVIENVVLPSVTPPGTEPKGYVVQMQVDTATRRLAFRASEDDAWKVRRLSH